jgi:hypothetical protein
MSEVMDGITTVTIMRPDDMVYVNGVAKPVDCSKLDPTIGTIQWRGVYGWIEYLNAGGAVFVPNETITDFKPYEEYVVAWVALDLDAYRRKKRLEAAGVF